MEFCFSLFSEDRPNLGVDAVFRWVFIVERCSCCAGGQFRLKMCSFYDIMKIGRKGVRTTYC